MTGFEFFKSEDKARDFAKILIENKGKKKTIGKIFFSEPCGKQMSDNEIFAILSGQTLIDSFVMETETVTIKVEKF